MVGVSSLSAVVEPVERPAPADFTATDWLQKQEIALARLAEVGFGAEIQGRKGNL